VNPNFQEIRIYWGDLVGLKSSMMINDKQCYRKIKLIPHKFLKIAAVPSLCDEKMLEGNM
jgi:hypothetical protein